MGKIASVRRVLILLVALALPLLVVACGSSEPESHGARDGRRDAARGRPARERGAGRGRRGRRQGDLRLGGLRRLPHARGRRDERHAGPEPRRVGDQLRGGLRSRSRTAAAACRPSRISSKSRRSRTWRPSSPSPRAAVSALELPLGFPREVEAFACDLDRTLIAEDLVLRPRTTEALTRARAAGIPVIVVTGRMFRSVRRYLEDAGLDGSGRLLPGRRRRRPGDGRVPAPRADPGRPRAGGDRRRRERGLRPQLLRRRRALRREPDPRGPALRGVPAHPDPRGRPAPRRGSTRRRRSSSRSATRSSSTSSRCGSRPSSARASSSPSRSRTSSSSRART